MSSHYCTNVRLSRLLLSAEITPVSRLISRWIRESQSGSWYLDRKNSTSSEGYIKGAPTALLLGSFPSPSSRTHSLYSTPSGHSFIHSFLANKHAFQRI